MTLGSGLFCSMKIFHLGSSPSFSLFLFSCTSFFSFQRIRDIVSHPHGSVLESWFEGNRYPFVLLEALTDTLVPLFCKRNDIGNSNIQGNNQETKWQPEEVEPLLRKVEMVCIYRVRAKRKARTWLFYPMLPPSDCCSIQLLHLLLA